MTRRAWALLVAMLTVQLSLELSTNGSLATSLAVWLTLKRQPFWQPIRPRKHIETSTVYTNHSLRQRYQENESSIRKPAQGCDATCLKTLLGCATLRPSHYESRPTCGAYDDPESGTCAYLRPLAGLLLPDVRSTCDSWEAAHSR